MEENRDLDKLRETVLKNIDQSKKRISLVLLFCGLTEAVLIIFYLEMMDFKNTLHNLVLLAAIWITTILGTGIFVLGMYNFFNTQRIIKAIYSLKNED